MRKKIFAYALLGALTILMSACGLLKSDKRTMSLHVRKYQNYIKEDNFSSAQKYCHPKRFQWKQQGQPVKTANPAAAFHESIRAVPSRQSFVIAIDKITALDERTFVLTGSMQVKQADAATLRSVRWRVNMTWRRYRDGKWRILEIDETSPRENFTS